MLDMHTKPEEMLKGRQTLTPREYEEWIAAVYGHHPDEVKYDEDADLLWYERRFDWDCPATGCTMQMHDPNPTWKPKRKPVKTMGHPFRSFADLAVLTRAWRKSIYKNIRYLYVKDGVIVDYERARRRVPANALSLAGDPRKARKHIKERFAGLGADSFFTVHNRYHVYSTPSAADRKLAGILGKAPGLIGHIIVNPYWFGLITVKGVAILRVLPDHRLPYADPVTHAYLRTWRGHDCHESTIADWGNALTNRRMPFVLRICEQTVLRELEELSLAKIDTWNKLVHRETKFGSPRPPIYDDAGPLLQYAGLYEVSPR
ncbi:MAG: hypothetical protein WB930_09115 [Syntrophobacteraceae bacterium]